MSDAPPQEWLETALRVTGHFEDAHDPLGAVTGDFDGMGISLGVLQWNIGSGSLQPMVKAIGQGVTRRAMPNYGDDLWQACTSPVNAGLATCRGWQNGAALRPDVLAELKALAHGPDFVARQLARAGDVAQAAFVAAKAYCRLDPAYADVTKHLFCWFFDLFTQNGGLMGLSYVDVENFVAGHGKARADDVICDWLAARGSKEAGYRDSVANAALWRDKVPADNLSLFVLSFLRAQKARIDYRGDVLNRKATIAIGKGWVHRDQHDLTRLLG